MVGLCYKFPTESNSERILKIGQYLVKLWARVRCLVFFDARCRAVLAAACRSVCERARVVLLCRSVCERARVVLLSVPVTVDRTRLLRAATQLH